MACWVDGDFAASTDCYFHSDTPEKVRHEFLANLRPPTGFVIVGFEQAYDFPCLVPETSLDLLDRALSAGDVVKRQLSHASSGTVISTSLSCKLRPLCSIEKYTARNLASPHGELSNADEEARIATLASKEAAHELLEEIPAQELRYWSQFREEDYVVYRDWVGQIQEVTDEVAVRLSNGSVVIVQNPSELEEPYWMPGSPSSDLHRRLLLLKYELHHSRKKRKPGKSWEAEPCYPGQIVETVKGNLRRGRWQFGAYDPNVKPRGMVVDVRSIELGIVWLYPNLFKPGRTQRVQPPDTLGVDILQSGAVTPYDHSRLPRKTDITHLPAASYSPDVGLGHRVRFRDPAGAAVKYRQFYRIPRAATQGHDMNILQVSRIKTTVKVQWQDGSTATIPSVELVPYDNVDDHDVWPGMLVSFKAAEIENKDADVTTCTRIGVVQAADAGERVARIRWFCNPIATIPRWDPSDTVAPTRFGSISDDVSEVSLYDIIPYPALARSRGDMLIVVPDPLPPIESVGAVRDAEYQEIVNEVYDNIEKDVSNLPASNIRSRPRTRRNAFDNSSQNATASVEPSPQTDIDWLGEVVDLGLDGRMVVRLGVADEVRDIHIPYERAVLIASHDDEGSVSDEEDSDEDSNETWESDYDGDDLSNPDMYLSLDIQYSGGQRLDDASGDEGWSTEEDEEMPDLIDLSPPRIVDRRTVSSEDELPQLVPLSTLLGHSYDDEEMPDLMDFLTPPRRNERHPSNVPEATSAPAEAAQTQPPPTNSKPAPTPTSNSTSTKPTITSAPTQFSILPEEPPSDHHYVSKSPSLTGAKMRRITKEHQMIASSLPEGVFVRTWEDRLDLLRVLIIGPQETPYELAPFVIDFYFHNDFPARPPEAHFHSWTNGVGRVNPNLYEDGNICLSLLGTWPGDNGKDTWSAKDSTMLQVIVSILGLVLVKEPYYNEAGFEILAGTPDSLTSSAQYTERAFVLSRGFVQAALGIRPGGFNDIIEWMYFASGGPRLLKTIIEESRALLQGDSERDSGGLTFGNGSGRLSRGAAILLKRTVKWLEEYAAERVQGEL